MTWMFVWPAIVIKPEPTPHWFVVHLDYKNPYEARMALLCYCWKTEKSYGMPRGFLLELILEQFGFKSTKEIFGL